MTPCRIKICGVTSIDDAIASVDAGADAIGLNFWRASKRRCDVAVAARIAGAIGERARVVGVFVDAPLGEITKVRAETGIEWIQLHGREPAWLLASLSPQAYRVVHPTDADSARDALEVAGEELLVDASVAGMPGGTGQTCDWELAAHIARARPIWLAGGLTPDNVADAVRAVCPYGVDVASGVERAPGVKDHALVRAFVHAARSVALSSHPCGGS